VPEFLLPEPLYPPAFDNDALYDPSRIVELHTAIDKRIPFKWFPKKPSCDARCDVEDFFSARYFATDRKTAVSEFLHRYPDFDHGYALWRGKVQLRRCLDLSDHETVRLMQLPATFLLEKPLFPWQFITACALSGNCDAVCFHSFRGGGLDYALFEKPAIIEEFERAE